MLIFSLPLFCFAQLLADSTISVTIPSSNNPVPTLTSIDPSSKTVGSSGFTMTLSGTNFISSSVVRFAGSDRNTTYINSTTLQAEILSSDLQNVGHYNITVFNPSPGGGESNAVVFRVTTSGGPPGNPVPTLTSIDPSSKTVGSSGFIMTLIGSGFISSSVVRFAGSDRTTTYINSTTLQAEILSSDLQNVGHFNITVFNPSPGGGESNAVVFTVNNSVPTLTSINPSSKIVGSSGFIMDLFGNNFISSSVVKFNGLNRQTEFINSQHLRAEILSSDLQNVGHFNITVFNPSPGGGESNALVFSVLYPTPILNSISPSYKTVNSSGFTLTLTGTNFISNSVVRFHGSNRTTTYINSTTLQAEILSSDLQNVGHFNITVFNPSPGGGESNAVIFQVVEIGENPLPILTSINPSSKTVGDSGFVMILTGLSFIPNSVVRFNNSSRLTTYVDSSTLQAEIPASDLTTVGNFNITVFNPSPGGGNSNAIIFTVNPKEKEKPPEEKPPEEKPPEKKPGEGRPSEEIIAPIILRPLDGTVQNKKLVKIEGKSQANQSIDIFANEKRIGTVFSDKNGDFELTIELEEGVYSLFASLKDVKSKEIKITIDLTPPKPPKLLKVKVIKEEPLIEKFNATILVQGEAPADTVSLKAIINPELLFPSPGEKWQKEFTITLSAGQHSIYARAYDLAGNESLPSNTLFFKIGVQPPPVVKEIKEIGKVIKKVIDNPQLEKIVEKTSPLVLPAVTTLSLVGAVSTATTAGLSLFRFLSLFYLLFTQPFVLIFSKKRRGWGIVYNSLTKQPVDLAVVRLFEAKENRLVSTKITDKEGRYIFIVNPGIYKITVDKPEYRFPTVVLKDYEEDLKYLDLYHGEEIEVKEKKTIINANIPLDPEKKLRPDSWLIRDHLFSILKQAIPIAAFVLSFLFFIMEPHPYLLIFFFLNLFLYLIILYLTPRPKKDWGVVREKRTRKSLPLTVVRIFEATFNKLLDQQVTNFRGQYGFLVGGRKFYLTYSKGGYEEKKSDILNFENKEKGSVVNLDVYLTKLKE